MIPFDFEYMKPKTVNEAMMLMTDSRENNLRAVYYGGGTELLTFFRKGKFETDVVIDLKGIKLLSTIEKNENSYHIGAATSLNEIIETVKIPVVQEVLRKIADHTTRNTLTIGGNICGRLPYREAILPLLMLNAKAVIITDQGLVEKPMRDIFDKRLKLLPSEFLVQIIVENQETTTYTKRFTEGTEVDYPIVHFVSMRGENEWFVGLSGYGSCPIYEIYNVKDERTPNQIIEFYTEVFESKARTCQKSSTEYKKYLLTSSLKEMVQCLGGGAGV